MNTKAKEILRIQKLNEQTKAVNTIIATSLVKGANAMAAVVLKIAKDPEIPVEEKIEKVVDLCEKQLKVGKYSDVSETSSKEGENIDSTTN